MKTKELLGKVCNELRNYISLLEWAGDYANAEDAKLGMAHAQTIRTYIDDLKKLKETI